MRIDVILSCQSKLLELVAALHSPGRFARSLHRRQEQCNQDSDNRNHDQEFHKREALAFFLSASH